MARRARRTAARTARCQGSKRCASSSPTLSRLGRRTARTFRRAMENQARITVLMPLKHYHPTYLDESLRSVMQQTSSQWRLVIIVEPQDLDHFGELLAAARADP